MKSKNIQSTRRTLLIAVIGVFAVGLTGALLISTNVRAANTAYLTVNEITSSSTSARAVSVTACKLVDADGNPKTTNDQTVRPDWIVTLYANNVVREVQHTGNNGCYTWRNLTPGVSYRVTEVVPERGWTPLVPTSYDFGPAVPGRQYSYTFINAQTVDVTACKLIDADGDLNTTNDQTPRQDWVVMLRENSRTIDSQRTGSNGCYTWRNLLPSNYGVAEGIPINGWSMLGPTEYDFQPGEYSHTFINFQNISITGATFYDHDNNGVRDDDEEGLANWTIQLSKWNGRSYDLLQPQVTTDTEGNYILHNVGAGTYQVREVLQDGWTQTTDQPADIITVGGTNVNGVDFGNAQL